jgi:hypothetical protein
MFLAFFSFRDSVFVLTSGGRSRSALTRIAIKLRDVTLVSMHVAFIYTQRAAHEDEPLVD